MKREITYRNVKGYQIPNLILPDDGQGEEVYIGVWGQRRIDYPKNTSACCISIRCAFH